MIGAIGSVCRLRPENAPLLLTTAREFVVSNMEEIDAADLLPRLEAPPRLSTTWVMVRALLGVEGEPNVRFTSSPDR